MSKKWTNNISQKQVADACAESFALYKQVSRHAKNELHAWTTVEELLRRFPPRPQREREAKRIKVDQLDYLGGLGIRSLKDLSSKLALQLIEFVLTGRRMYDGYWSL